MRSLLAFKQGAPLIYANVTGLSALAAAATTAVASTARDDDDDDGGGDDDGDDNSTGDASGDEDDKANSVISDDRDANRERKRAYSWMGMSEGGRSLESSE